MRILRNDVLVKCCQTHADSKKHLEAWRAEADQASWKTPNDIKQHYPKADILPDNRVVFDIKGKHYRVVVKINYSAGIVEIRFAGTHAEYNRIDATQI